MSSRVFALTTEEEEATEDMVSTTFPSPHRSMTILFDSGTTHSIMSYQCGLLFEVKEEPLDFVLMVATSVGLSMLCDQIVKNFPFSIGDSTLPANLVLMDTVDFDIIFGMDWLPTYHALMDYLIRK